MEWCLPVLNEIQQTKCVAVLCFGLCTYPLLQGQICSEQNTLVAVFSLTGFTQETLAWFHAKKSHSQLQLSETFVLWSTDDRDKRDISCETKVFSPRHATLLAHAPCLNLRDDLSLEYDGLPCGHLLSQQVAHGGGELGLRLYDLRRLLVHHHGAGAWRKKHNLSETPRSKHSSRASFAPSKNSWMQWLCHGLYCLKNRHTFANPAF